MHNIVEMFNQDGTSNALCAVNTLRLYLDVTKSTSLKLFVNPRSFLQVIVMLLSEGGNAVHIS